MSGLLPIVPRLAKLLPLLASDKDGEVLAAARAINRALTSSGLDFHDLVDALKTSTPRENVRRRRAPQPSPSTAPNPAPTAGWRGMVRWCCIHGMGRLTTREAEFVADMANLANQGSVSRHPSEKQQAWLDAIFSRLRAEAA